MPKDRAMRAFVIHLGVYVLVVGLFAVINLYRNPNHIWFIWVLAGWGIGVAAHDLALLLASFATLSRPNAPFLLVSSLALIVLNIIPNNSQFAVVYLFMGAVLIMSVKDVRRLGTATS